MVDLNKYWTLKHNNLVGPKHMIGNEVNFETSLGKFLGWSDLVHELR